VAAVVKLHSSLAMKQIIAVATDRARLSCAQVARNIADLYDGFLRDRRYLIRDRDKK
jgi:hypothetical protein